MHQRPPLTLSQVSLVTNWTGWSGTRRRRGRNAPLRLQTRMTHSSPWNTIHYSQACKTLEYIPWPSTCWVQYRKGTQTSECNESRRRGCASTKHSPSLLVERTYKADINANQDKTEEIKECHDQAFSFLQLRLSNLENVTITDLVQVDMWLLTHCDRR